MEYNHPEIPVLFDGTKKWITGLTPKTTCDDVIHSLLINVGCPIPHEAVRNYALFENWRGVERSLKGRSRFMKLIRDWGEEALNVEVTMRRVDSTLKDEAMYGSLSRRKNRIKDWFKTKDKKSKGVAKSMQNIPQDVENLHDESSFLAQNKDNMFCALSCYKRRQERRGLRNGGGLRERDTNIQTPFERPRSVAVVPPHTALDNPVYHSDALAPNLSNSQQPLTKQYSLSQVSHYGSRTSLKQTYVTRHHSCYFEDDVENIDPVYSTLASSGVAREQYCTVEHPYTNPDIKSHKRTAPQNVHDWDYDYNRQTDYNSESDAESVSSCRELVPARPSTASSTNTSQDYNDSRFKSLLNLVLSQERKIQEQFSLIKEADKRIEKYEFAMHRLRASQQGQDYLQNTYLSGQDDTLTDEKLCSPGELGSMRSRVHEMDGLLQRQYHKLHDLSIQLESETKHLEHSLRCDRACDRGGNNTTQTEGPFESTRLSPIAKCNELDLETEIVNLKKGLQRSISLSLAQQDEIKNMDFNLQKYQQEVKEKQDKLSELVNQLELSPSSNSFEAPSAFTRCQPKYQAGAGLVAPVQTSVAWSSQAPRALTRQLKSMSDLQPATAYPVTSQQQSMRRSISDLRESLHRQATSNGGYQKDYSSSENLIFSSGRTLLPMPPVGPIKNSNISEMGLDVCNKNDRKPPRKLRNETDDLKHRQHHDPANSEVQRILARRVNMLTPIKEQDMTHTILEYHNETVDLDALMKKAYSGRAQNTNKMFTENKPYKPTEPAPVATETHQGKEHKPSWAKLVYEADIDNEKETLRGGCETISSANDYTSVADLSLNSEANRSTTLPPFGIETMANILGKRLMPSLFDESMKASETFEVSHTSSHHHSDNTSLWGTPTVNQTNRVEIDNKTLNNTSVWCTQNVAPDGTFLLATGPKNDLQSDVGPQREEQSSNPPGELTLYAENSHDTSVPTDLNVSVRATEHTALVIRQTIAASLEFDSPVSDVASVKKRLFDDEDNSDDTLTENGGDEQTVNATESSMSSIERSKMAAVAFAEDTNIESTLWATSDSSESGVGSLHSGDDSELNCSSGNVSKQSFSETPV